MNILPVDRHIEEAFDSREAFNHFLFKVPYIIQNLQNSVNHRISEVDDAYTAISGVIGMQDDKQQEVLALLRERGADGLMGSNAAAAVAMGRDGSDAQNPLRFACEELHRRTRILCDQLNMIAHEYINQGEALARAEHRENQQRLLKEGALAREKELQKERNQLRKELRDAKRRALGAERRLARSK